MERLTAEDELLRLKRRNAEYKRKYRINHPYHEIKQKQKPEYQEREKMRLKKCYERTKIFKILPQLATF